MALKKSTNICVLSYFKSQTNSLSYWTLIFEALQSLPQMVIDLTFKLRHNTDTMNDKVQV